MRTGRPRTQPPITTRSLTVKNDTALKLSTLQKELTEIYGHHVSFADVVEQLIQNCTRQTSSRHWKWEIQKNPISRKVMSKIDVEALRNDWKNRNTPF